ncbi:MAG: GxxExxY protein [Patescibacteria group bacterium]|nr:GxxExxY protein [Patescibacteria group bacterium]
MGEIFYKDLSYRIIGLVFEVFNNLGFGYREKYYQRALAEELKNSKINYKKEVPVRLFYKNRLIGKYIIDFVIEDKIILEIKIAKEFYTKDIKQLLGYLKAKNLKLGMLIIFTKDGIKYRRIVN